MSEFSGRFEADEALIKAEETLRSSFVGQFEAYGLTQRSSDEEIQADNAENKEARFGAIRTIEARKLELQLVVANMMREDAKAIVGLIPKDVEPSTLIITESHFEQPDEDEVTSQTQLYNKGGVKVETTQLGKVDAYMVSPRYQRTVEDETQTLIFTPIFVATDGELWIAPKHELRSNDYFPNASIQEVIGRKRSLYRKTMRGLEIEGRPKRYRTWVDSNSPRPATDEDLVPVEKLSILQLESDITKGKLPEVVVDWHSDLFDIVKV